MGIYKRLLLAVIIVPISLICAYYASELGTKLGELVSANISKEISRSEGAEIFNGMLLGGLVGICTLIYGTSKKVKTTEE